MLSMDDGRTEAFKNEVKNMKALDHPNICKCLESYEQGRHLFLVTEFCPGKDLLDRLIDSDEGMVEESFTMLVVEQVASALMYAHGRRIAHRDLKPENVCFCSEDWKDSDIKVIDWGLSRFFGQGEMHSIVGTVSYTAPEVLMASGEEGDFYDESSTGGETSRPYTEACDLWSLGVLIYFMLSGVAPFSGTESAQLRNMRAENVSMEAPCWARTSDEAKAFILSLLRWDPQDRPEMAGLLVHPVFQTARLRRKTQPSAMEAIAANLRLSQGNAQFLSICHASAARQLDHKDLKNIYEVFRSRDENGDGYLSLEEFRKVFEDLKYTGVDVDSIFTSIDLDGSHRIDYTEFCAAALGEKVFTQDEALWSSFKAFDVHKGDGKLTREELVAVLKSADANKAWPHEDCKRVADELMAKFDVDNDGFITFEEWAQTMRQAAEENAAPRLLSEEQPERQTRFTRL